MRTRLSFRGLIVLLYLGSLIPLLTLVGLVGFRMQQDFLLTDARDRLIEFVRADVTELAPDADLTNLAVQLGEHLRVLGADLFVQDAEGRPVPPALGTGPWLDDAAHRTARETRRRLAADDSCRFLAPDGLPGPRTGYPGQRALHRRSQPAIGDDRGRVGRATPAIHLDHRRSSDVGGRVFLHYCRRQHSPVGGSSAHLSGGRAGRPDEPHAAATSERSARPRSYIQCDARPHSGLHRPPGPVDR